MIWEGISGFTFDHVKFDKYVAHPRRDLKQAVELREKNPSWGICKKSPTFK